MPLKTRALMLLFVLVLSLDPLRGQVAVNKDSQSLDSLRSLNYSADNGPSATPSLGYAELFRLLTACEAYANGLHSQDASAVLNSANKRLAINRLNPNR